MVLSREMRHVGKKGGRKPNVEDKNVKRIELMGRVAPTSCLTASKCLDCPGLSDSQI